MSAVGLAIGAAFGFLIAAARLNDYEVIHRMLLLREPDVFLLMGAAVAVAMPVLWALERRRARSLLGGELRIARARVERKHILGSIVFGTGWAITGTCPGTALAMPFSGVLLGIPVIAGIIAGQLLRETMADARRATAAAGATPAGSAATVGPAARAR